MVRIVRPQVDRLAAGEEGEIDMEALFDEI